MKSKLLLAFLALLLVGCASFPKVPCGVFMIPCEPSPAPPSPSPDPGPVVTPPPTPPPSPSPIPTVEPPASPQPSPTVAPPPSPKPCVPSAPLPTCIKPEGCSSCAQWIAWSLAGGHLTRLPNGLLYNDPGNNPALREYVDPKTCFMVWADGSLRNKRYHLDGTICPDCPPWAVPECEPQASPSPGATPQPGPTPGTCPMLVRWGGGLHAQMTPQFQGIPKTPTFAGNTIDFDSTARFGNGGRGLPCNDEHHAVCEKDGIDDGPNWRRCEDPRGPIFTITSGGGDKVTTINDGWGLRIKGVHAGRLCVRIEPRPDVQDALGLPVRVGPNPATESCVDVQ